MAKKVAVVAIGGNSLIKDNKHQTVEDQYQAAKESMHHIADMIEAGWDVVIGHGNGPQVGFILRRSEIAHKVEGMHEVPLDSAARTRRAPSAISLQQNLQNEFQAARDQESRSRRWSPRCWLTATTRLSRIPPNRSADSWTKPTPRTAREGLGWSVVEDAGRGWRRVVASPIPEEVVEAECDQEPDRRRVRGHHRRRRRHPGDRERQRRSGRRRSGDRQGLRQQPAGAR